MLRERVTLWPHWILQCTALSSLSFPLPRSLALALLGSRASCTAWVLPDENETDFCLVRAAASCDLITRVFQPKIFPLLRVSWSRGRRHFCLFVLGVAVVAAMREMQRTRYARREGSLSALFLPYYPPPHFCWLTSFASATHPPLIEV